MRWRWMGLLLVLSACGDTFHVTVSVDGSEEVDPGQSYRVTSSVGLAPAVLRALDRSGPPRYIAQGGRSGLYVEDSR